MIAALKDFSSTVIITERFVNVTYAAHFEAGWVDKN